MSSIKSSTCVPTKKALWINRSLRASYWNEYFWQILLTTSNWERIILTKKNEEEDRPCDLFFSIIFWSKKIDLIENRLLIAFTLARERKFSQARCLTIIAFFPSTSPTMADTWLSASAVSWLSEIRRVASGGGEFLPSFTYYQVRINLSLMASSNDWYRKVATLNKIKVLST